MEPDSGLQHRGLPYSSCAQRLRALADAERLRIVEALFAGERNVSELAHQLTAEIPNVSHHLSVLRTAGLVVASKRGRFVVYSLDPSVARRKPGAGAPRSIDLGCCTLQLDATDARAQF